MYLRIIGHDSLIDEIKNTGCDSFGFSIMQSKARILGFKVEDLNFQACMILKQEALSAQAEFATPKECILGKKECYSGVLFGSLVSLERLASKLSLQPFGLKKFSKMLQANLYSIKKSSRSSPLLMAVLNVTPDSFYEGSRVDLHSCKRRILELLDLGIRLIDIGGASSRPGSNRIEAREELDRLDGIFDFIVENRLFNRCDFSIDTYNFDVAKKALISGFRVVNDVSGLADTRMCNLCLEYGARLVLMHTRGEPKNMGFLTHYENLFLQMDAFFESKLEVCYKLGFKDIILDIGFGFAKNSSQNLFLIKNLSHFKRFGLPILVGASRKSTLQKIIQKRAENALSATLAIHLLALLNGADILRVHDSLEHLDLLAIFEAYRNVQAESLFEDLEDNLYKKPPRE